MVLGRQLSWDGVRMWIRRWFIGVKFLTKVEWRREGSWGEGSAIKVGGPGMVTGSWS